MWGGAEAQAFKLWIVGGNVTTNSALSWQLLIIFFFLLLHQRLHKCFGNLSCCMTWVCQIVYVFWHWSYSQSCFVDYFLWTRGMVESKNTSRSAVSEILSPSSTNHTIFQVLSTLSFFWCSIFNKSFSPCSDLWQTVLYVWLIRYICVNKCLNRCI